MRPVYLLSLKVGEAFTFAPATDAPVYVRARGGYRPGRGGPLVKASAETRVYRYKLGG